MIRYSLFLLISFCVAIPELAAQTTRPGSTVRGGTRSTATRGGTAGSSRSSGGPRQYRSNTELGDAVIQIDPETRSLVILTDDATNEELVKIIRLLDKPKPQVLIKVVFVEVTYNKGSDIGVEGSYTFNLQPNAKGAVTGSDSTTTTETRTTSSGGTTNSTRTTSTDLGRAAEIATAVTGGSNFGVASALASGAQGTFVRVLSDDFSATLRALATKGKVEVVSRPSIMARNNQEAVIVVGSEVPFVTNSRITDNGQTINTVTYDNVGIILRVTPFITSEGTVEMIVAPEISQLTDQTVPISDTASAPVISKRSAETVIVTPDAQTVVIGGLMQTQKVEAVQKVPILGDIPLLGFAFRRTVKNDVKSELMIFLTPYIVNDPAHGDYVTNMEINKADLMQKSIGRKEIGRYLDMPQLETESDEATRTTVERDSKSMVSPAPVQTTRTSETRVVRRAAPVSAAAVPAPKSIPEASDTRRRRVNPKGAIQ